MTSVKQSEDTENQLEHGYDLANIERTLDRYHGLMHYTMGDVFQLYIRVPIIDPKQRMKRSTQTLSNEKTILN